MRQKEGEDWIEYMADQVHLNYKGREVAIWGSYGVADSIREKLEAKYGIDTAFYVDSDRFKVDGRKVFSPGCLAGKANQYYVVVPIAFYPAVREQLARGGYKQDVDYCYFCDCALRQEADYYEDAHGNKIIGNYQGLKFVFSGFHSVIKIGAGVRFRESGIYLHNGSEVEFGDGVQCEETELIVYSGATLSIAEEVLLRGDYVSIGEDSIWEINRGCHLAQLRMVMGKDAKAELGDEVHVDASGIGIAYWSMGDSAKVKIGGKGRFSGFGQCELFGKASLEIGEKFTISNNYQILLPHGTGIVIGDDCMFSWNTTMNSSDCHSIFDVVTGKNINSTYDIAKGRRIVIGNHVWVGDYACILYRTRIGDGSIIGAMGLVKSEIPNNCIAAGNPARVIRKNIAWSRKNGAEDIRECGQAYVKYTEETGKNADINFK